MHLLLPILVQKLFSLELQEWVHWNITGNTTHSREVSVENKVRIDVLVDLEIEK